MALNPQALLRSVRTAHLDHPGRDADPRAPVPVLYVPAASRDRAVVRDRIARAGAAVSLAADLPDALQMLGTRRFGLVVVDLASERVALATVRLLRAQFPGVSVVGVIDPAQPLGASEAIYAGVTDLLAWPLDDRDVAAMIAAARDSSAVDPSPARSDITDRLFEHAPAMRPVVEAMKAAASRRSTVLIVGERGSGRGLVARTVHERDHDVVSRPLVVVDCAQGGPHELERRLFGAADRFADDAGGQSPERAARGSAIVAAQGGSLFLTNVMEAPVRVQAQLARVLRDREVFSVELGETIPLDVRVMASVGSDVDAAVSDGRLRRDLKERLAQVRVELPPLRRRREDIPLLASHFLRHACEAEGAGPKRFSRAALTLLSALPWPGNASELQMVVRESVKGSRDSIIRLEDVLAHASLDQSAGPTAAAGLNLRDAREHFEREYISATLLRHRGRAGDAAKALGIQRTNLYRKVRQLKVPRALLSARK